MYVKSIKGAPSLINDTKKWGNRHMRRAASKMLRAEVRKSIQKAARQAKAAKAQSMHAAEQGEIQQSPI